MRMRYEGPSSTGDNHHRTGARPLTAPKPTHEPSSAMAVHGSHHRDSYSVQSQSLVLHDKLRRLAAFLALPVRAARSFLRTALVKIRQIQRVILS